MDATTIKSDETVRNLVAGELCQHTHRQRVEAAPTQVAAATQATRTTTPYGPTGSGSASSSVTVWEMRSMNSSELRELRATAHSTVSQRDTRLRLARIGFPYLATYRCLPSDDVAPVAAKNPVPGVATLCTHVPL